MRSTLRTLLTVGLCWQYGHSSAFAAVPDGRPVVPSSFTRNDKALKEHTDSSQTCTKPLAPAPNQPYCFVPSTITRQAQNFLRHTSVAPAPELITNEAAEIMRATFNSRVGQLSADTARNYLQSVQNSTIAGVPVSVGIPKGLQPHNRRKMIMMVSMNAYGSGEEASRHQQNHRNRLPPTAYGHVGVSSSCDGILPSDLLSSSLSCQQATSPDRLYTQLTEWC